jgi:hypothetical protein
MSKLHRLGFVVALALTVFVVVPAQAQTPWYGGPMTAVVAQGQAPSAFRLNGQLYVFFFDDSGVPGDDVYLSYNFGARQKVVGRTNWMVAPDAGFAAAPGVIQHPNPDPYGMAPYLLYYECSKRHWDIANPQTDERPLYVEICLAGSWDLANWYKYNQDIGGFHTGTPTVLPQLQFSASRKAECSEAISGDRWVWNFAGTNCANTNPENYGVGHPSPVVDVSPRIFLYYNDSHPASGPTQMMWRALSWDGVHFEPPQMTNLPGAYTVRYHTGAGTYVATANYGGENRFFLSSDGLTFSGPYWMPRNNGDPMKVVYDGSVVSDQFGRISSWTVPFISSEGTPCSSPPFCPNATTDWYMYYVDGTFFGL